MGIPGQTKLWKQEDICAKLIPRPLYPQQYPVGITLQISNQAVVLRQGNFYTLSHILAELLFSL